MLSHFSSMASQNTNIDILLSQIQELSQQQIIQNQQEINQYQHLQEDQHQTSNILEPQNEEPEGIEYDAEIMIDLIRQEPSLWNTQCRSYKEAGKKRNAWLKIANTFNNKDGVYMFK